MMSKYSHYDSTLVSTSARRAHSAVYNTWIFGVPLWIVRDRLDLHTMLFTRSDQAVPREEMPIVCLVRAGFACDDDVLAVVFGSFHGEAICRSVAVRVVRIFPVERSASFRGVVSIDVSHEVGVGQEHFPNYSQ
jgi:hypothetical protein